MFFSQQITGKQGSTQNYVLLLEALVAIGTLLLLCTSAGLRKSYNYLNISEVKKYTLPIYTDINLHLIAAD